jgi:hypothetical protein
MRTRAYLIVALLALGARSGAGQASDTARREGAAVSGLVYDSLAQRPLAGALVQLVANEGGRVSRTATSDTLGRFVIANVADGRYTVGFFHPMLDSLGLEPPMREVVVQERGPVRADLAIPSPARLRLAICGRRAVAGSRSDSGAVVVGIVRDARDRTPAMGAAVAVEWLEFSFTKDGVIRRIPRLVATTGPSGWFALCDVPSRGIVGLVASRGTDSTDRLEVLVPAEGFLRRDLYLAPPLPVQGGSQTSTNDSTRADSIRKESIGDQRLSGTVLTAEGGRPIGRAQVSLSRGPQTRANERGEWMLAGAPVGTRMLEVKALGYYPERRAVDVVAGAAPIHVVLSTLKAVLDTVRVRARVPDRHFSGFEDRRRTSGVGRFLTLQEIARKKPIVVSDLFRSMAGMRVERTPEGGTQIQIRGVFEDWCAPTFYLDGRSLGEITAEEVDTWVQPREVAGIEVYVGTGVPPQFSTSMAGPMCGAVVIWTR